MGEVLSYDQLVDHSLYTTWPTWLLIILVITGTHRLTRIVTYDQFPLIAIPRERFTNWFDPSPDWLEHHPSAHPRWGWVGRSLAYLTECDWCVSIWVGALVTWLTFEQPVTMQWILLALTASTFTGLLAGSKLEDRT